MRLRNILIISSAMLLIIAVVFLAPLPGERIDISDYYLSEANVVRWEEVELIGPTKIGVPCINISSKSLVNYDEVEIVPGVKVKIPVIRISTPSTGETKCSIDIAGYKVKIPKKVNATFILKVINKGYSNALLDRAYVEVYINGVLAGGGYTGESLLRRGINYVKASALIDLEEALKSIMSNIVVGVVNIAAGRPTNISINIHLKIEALIKPGTAIGIPSPITHTNIYDIEKNISIPIPSYH